MFILIGKTGKCSCGVAFERLISFTHDVYLLSRFRYVRYKPNGHEAHGKWETLSMSHS